MFQNRSILKSLLRNLWTSKSGGVLIYIAFGLPMLLGAMALSIDLGRVFILNTELDGRVGARAAAEAAARTGISGTLLNAQAFATDGGGPGIVVDQVVVSTLASLR